MDSISFKKKEIDVFIYEFKDGTYIAFSPSLNNDLIVRGKSKQEIKNKIDIAILAYIAENENEFF